MEKPGLDDENVFPDDTVLRSSLGENKATWDKFIGLIQKDYPSFNYEWRFYNDGHRWLFKVTQKAKTICWVSVWDGFYKVSFYFGDKAEDLIVGSDLDKMYKEQFISGKRYGKIRAITVDVDQATKLETIKLLAEIKTKLK